MGGLPRFGCVAAALALVAGVGCGGQASHSDPLAASVSDGDASAASGVTGGAWGELPIPETCVTTSGTTYFSDGCELQVNCGGNELVADCGPLGDDYSCSCGAFEYLLSGVTQLSDACPYAIAACLHALPFESGPTSCTAFYEEDTPDFCSAESRCTSDGMLGQVSFTESHHRWADCSPNASGFSCLCLSPLVNFRRFEGPTGDFMSVCPDARDWCAGDGLEFGGHPECARDGRSTVTPYGCYARVECKQAVQASGLDATMYDSVPVECGPGSDGRYECACPLHRFSVTAPDSASACDSASDICAGRLMTQ